MPSAKYGFNGNPTSVSVKTGSYNIPAGNYAYVTAVCESGQTFSIDGTAAMTTFGSISATGTVNSGSPVTLFTAASNSPAMVDILINCAAGVTGTLTMNGHTLQTTAASTNYRFYQIYVPAAATVTLTSLAGNTTYSVAGSYVTESSKTASFWVPTGTALTTSNGRYTVALF